MVANEKTVKSKEKGKKYISKVVKFAYMFKDTIIYMFHGALLQTISEHLNENRQSDAVCPILCFPNLHSLVINDIVLLFIFVKKYMVLYAKLEKEFAIARLVHSVSLQLQFSFIFGSLIVGFIHLHVVQNVCMQ